MFKNSKSKTISVSDLSRYWGDEQGFEKFKRDKPNQIALKNGQRFHDVGLFWKIPKILIILIVGACGYAYLTLYSNHSIF